MKLVLFSDVHLDAAFAWLGASQGMARRRRQALRDTLRRIATLAQDEEADALLCAGDLYEDSRASDDTGEFLRATFAHLQPMPVFVAPGNHDYFGPRSLYRRVRWSSNVHIFTEARLQPVELDDGISLWGAGHRAPANTLGFLDGFRVDRGGTNIALFHGSLQAPFLAFEEGKVPHAPFMVEQIREAGLAHACLGHYHRPSSTAWHTYPGNPDPMTFGEDGERGAVVLTLGEQGVLLRATHRVNLTEVHDCEVDLTGCASSQDVRDLLTGRLLGLSGVARVTLRGELPSQVDLRLPDVQSVPTTLDGLVVRIGDLHTAFDLTSIANEPTVRGQFVRDVQASPLNADDMRRVLATGLRALEDRDEPAW